MVSYLGIPDAIRNRHWTDVEFSDKCKTRNFFRAPRKYKSPILRWAARLETSSRVKPSDEARFEVSWLAQPRAMTKSARHELSESSVGGSPPDRTAGTSSN